MQQTNSSDNAVSEDLAALSRQALQHFKNGRLQQAQDVCERILQKKKHSGALLILGWVAHQQHEFEEAVERYQQYLGLKPDDAEARYTLGLALEELERTDLAIEHYKKSIIITADNELVHGQLGDAYTKLQRWEDAIKAYQQALTISADDVVTIVKLANVFQ